jgi:Mn2+/Fe2+ NRAMP family transporter
MWSVISAAFIGPGTVTTASRAGSSYGLALVWALLFSVVATYVLQETTARLTMVSGKSFGAWIDELGWRHTKYIKMGLFVALFIGCAAFQSGNMLGAQEGVKLFGQADPLLLKALIVLISFAVLTVGSPQTIAKILGGLVAIMSVCYIWLALQIQLEENTLSNFKLQPRIPEGAGWLIAGLIGTTVVPYNLFLGSGLAKGTDLKEMRLGLSVAIGLGGLITFAVLMTGTEIPPEFSFRKMYVVFESRGNTTMAYIASGGLVAAGLSSAITCPLAAAIGAGVILSDEFTGMRSGGKGYQTVWMLVLAIGAMFLFFNSKPIPAIITAQAINGILLPVMVFFLLILANDKKLIGNKWKNKLGQNLISGLILFAIVWISVNSLQILFGVHFDELSQMIINSVAAIAVVVAFGVCVKRMG